MTLSPIRQLAFERNGNRMNIESQESKIFENERKSGACGLPIYPARKRAPSYSPPLCFGGGNTPVEHGIISQALPRIVC
jgi:hypothetical protein